MLKKKNENGALCGTVVDVTGAAVHDACIEVLQNNDFVTSARTNDSGNWVVFVKPGMYKVRVRGYTSVPETGCEWWRRLPSLPLQRKAKT